MTPRSNPDFKSAPSLASRADHPWDGPVVSTLADDPDFAELLEQFVQEMPARAQAIEDAWRTRDGRTLRRLAHQLRGSAGGHGFAGLGQVAGEVEDALASDGTPGSDVLTERDAARVGELVASLTHLCRRIRARRAA